MAVPNKRHTKSARNQRRANQKLAQPTITTCPMCKSPKLPHHVCQVCGTYNNRKVLERSVSKKTTKKK